ncbi:hypothetical protein [Streptomyces venezuelae]|uniref:Uncharacterized protein n=1 Tax=Streptomyces venezuelae TaxID=54571 RepID=A0A5P2B3H3_STRVZ|nr:hypothetical protein [Streptomyces venezuelae]QES25152.1 hypothetical protein DEJ47_00555 [Streptomyces venezuelae]
MDTDSTAYAPGPGLTAGPGPASGHRFGAAVSVRPRHDQAVHEGGPTLFLLTRAGGGHPAAGPTRHAW